jgi:hypothetical protein
MPRLDSSLEAAGAEFLVLGELLIEGIPAYKAYTNLPGYDIIATNPDKGKSCRIQVKSRWATDYDGGFPIRNFDCDFVAFVALNRGYRYRRKVAIDNSGRRAPDIYVFPVDVVRGAQDPKSNWGKVFLRNIEDSAQYLHNWNLVKVALGYS